MKENEEMCIFPKYLKRTALKVKFLIVVVPTRRITKVKQDEKSSSDLNLIFKRNLFLKIVKLNLPCFL